MNELYLAILDGNDEILSKVSTDLVIWEIGLEDDHAVVFNASTVIFPFIKTAVESDVIGLALVNAEGVILKRIDVSRSFGVSSASGIKSPLIVLMRYQELKFYMYFEGKDESPNDQI